ncbi:MAG: hypothetical protein IPF42_11590 [Candidatus Microthrix sp.]|nr:hypothetical protein [Candidatus Microthrix sp.]
MSQVAPDTHQIDDEARPGAWAADTSLDVIEVVGPDAVGYLQGQLSQNVSGAVGRGRRRYCWSPRARCAPGCVHRAADDTVHLVVDAGFGTVVEQRLRRLAADEGRAVDGSMCRRWPCAWPDGFGRACSRGRTPGGARPDPGGAGAVGRRTRASI